MSKSCLTTLCYLEQDGKYLMMHRVSKKNDVNRDKWIGVGGHFEEGESPEECLQREVKEETGLELLSWRFRGIVTFIADEHPAEYMCLTHQQSGTGTPPACRIAGRAFWNGCLRMRSAACSCGRVTGFSCGCWRKTLRFSP